MGFWDFLLGNSSADSGIGDEEITGDLLKDLRAGILFRASAIAGLTHPELRQICLRHLSSDLALCYQLADFATTRGWYNPYLPPPRHLIRDAAKPQAAAPPETGQFLP